MSGPLRHILNAMQAFGCDPDALDGLRAIVKAFEALAQQRSAR